ncbi:MAG: hypothetical protein L0Y76_02690, partial [Ignavibacteria bacterium]|nr:hypothetical protein [Ignavibacteria bacterium]
VPVFLWQLFFILFFPDPDTDAYAHFIIARDIVRHPFNLSVHWVWLPLFHYIGAFFVFLGSNMQSLRFVNLLLWFLLPVMTYVFLSSKESSKRYALTAGIITAVSPIGILMGTTAQPEPLFALLILLFVFLFEKKDYYSSSFILTLACLLRYEAWAVLLFVSVYVLYLRIYKAQNLEKRKKISVLSVLILPVAVITVWSVLRYLYDGQWFMFLSGTQKFANDALGETNSAEGGVFQFIRDLFYYPFWIPFLYFGITLFFIPFGFVKFIKENIILSVAGFSILVFITVSWLLKSNLGLNRHFNSVVPVYSILIAYGLFDVIDRTKPVFERKIKTINAFRNLTVSNFWKTLTFVILAFYTVMWLYIYIDGNKGIFDERYRTVDYIKTISDRSIVVCNDPVLEVLSGADYKLFDHFWMGSNEETFQYLKSLMRYNNNVYVVAGEELKDYLRYNSIIMFESGINPKNGNSIYILKII